MHDMAWYLSACKAVAASRLHVLKRSRTTKVMLVLLPANCPLQPLDPVVAPASWLVVVRPHQRLGSSIFSQDPCSPGGWPSQAVEVHWPGVRRAGRRQVLRVSQQMKCCGKADQCMQREDQSLCCSAQYTSPLNTDMCLALHWQACMHVCPAHTRSGADNCQGIAAYTSS